MLFGGTSILILLLAYVVVIAVIGLALYWVVRLAVLHALKRHTEWLRGQAPGGHVPDA